MARLVVALLLMSALVAGCTAPDEIDTALDGEDDSDDADGEGALDDVLAGVVAPEWAPGHSWRFSSSFGDFHIVVTGDAGDDWVVDTPDAETAWFDFREPISFLGLVRKSDLAGSQGNDRVEYLKFPLEANKTWTTNWDGLPHEIKIVEVGEVFRLEAHQEGQLAVTYTYDPTVAWFSEFVFYGDDGQAMFTSTLSEHRKDWSGEVFRWQGEAGFQSAAADQFGSRTQSFTVGDGLTDVWVLIDWSCEGDAGVLNAEFGPLGPDAPSQGIILTAPECESFAEEFVIETPAVGEWLAGYHFAAAPTAGLQMEVWMRTLETLQVTP